LNKKVLLVGFTFGIILLTIIPLSLQTNSTNITMQKLQIKISRIEIYDAFESSAYSYSLLVAAEYFRFFDYYGNNFDNQDNEYNDYDRTFYNYPDAWAGGQTITMEGDLNLPWTFCVPLTYNEASEVDNNEIFIEFKFHRGVYNKYVQIYLGDTEVYDTWFWYNSIYCNDWSGGINIYMMIDYL